MLSLNGTIRRNDLITASVTISDKKNIADDFSPDFPTGYPNDPADMEAEWGHARGHERGNDSEEDARQQRDEQREQEDGEVDSHVAETRQLRVASNGDVFVASPSNFTAGGEDEMGVGAIVVLPDDNHDGVADSALTFIDDLPQTQGSVIAGDYL